MIDGLNANHRRALAAAFGHLDELLGDVEAALAATETRLGRYTQDLAPVERRVVGDYVAHVRARLGEALDALGIADTGGKVPVRRAIDVALLSALIDLEDVAPKRLRGYGAMTADAAELLGRVEEDVARTINRVRAYLTQGLGRDLAGRLARLEKTPFDMAEVRALADAIAEHGLVELRGLLEALVEALEAHRFEVAVFGRVSSGKSSLLDAVLETDVLPVGVTPVTAVPTRILRGDAPSATVHVAEQAPVAIDVRALADYVSEAGNPGNRRHVVRVEVRIPSPWLSDDVVLVDTPGIGSLAASGTRETMAYLPRCDLGVVLFDATGAASSDDLDLVRRLYDSGIPALLVLTKVDLLDDASRERARAWLRGEVERALGLDVPVHLASAVDKRLARRFWDEALAPELARAQALREASLRRKVAHLRESVAAMLRVSTARAGIAKGEVERLAHDVEGRLGQAARRCNFVIDRIPFAPRVLDAAATRVVRDRADEAAAVAAVIDEIDAALAAALREELLATRDDLRRLLVEMGADAARAEEVHVDLVAMPRFDVGRLDAVAAAPGWRRSVPLVAGQLVRNQLAAHFEERVGRLLADGQTAMRRFVARALARLAEQAAAHAEPLRAVAGAAESA